MGRMVEGEWIRDDISAARGAFRRAPTTFREEVDAADVAPGRYHLYVSYACPWANRTLIVRALRGLQDAVPVSIVAPDMMEDGWTFGGFPGATEDRLLGTRALREVYVRADPRFTGRVTVPVLWDTVRGTIVNNESRDIIRMFDTVFDALATGPTLRPAHLAAEVDAVIDAIYPSINNGVYRAGFAGTQEAYEAAVTELFEALAHWDAHLAEREWLVGDQLTEADVCLFTTLVRFDAVYHTHFKCNLKRLRDHRNLWRYVARTLAVPGVRETVRLDHIKRHYFFSHRNLNPKGIVPLGPADPLPEPLVTES